MEKKDINKNLLNNTTAYHYMEILPGQLLAVVESYYKQIQEEEARHKRVIESIKKTYEDKKRNLNEQRKIAHEEAQEAQTTILSQIDALKTEMDTENNRCIKATDALLINRIAKNPSLGDRKSVV